MTDQAARSSVLKRRRPDLADRVLVTLVGAMAAAIALYFVAKPYLPTAFQRPGTALLQSAALLGTLLLLTPAAFALAKRRGRSEVPNRWFIAHVVASLAGMVLVAIHSTGELLSPPSFMLLALAGLTASGAIGRVRVSRDMAATLGSKRAPFAPIDPALQKQIRALIGQKAALLAELDPPASEATFSVTLKHWLAQPRAAFAYADLARREADLIGARQSVGQLQAWWRPLHIALAALFVIALVIHIVAVTFFAGYVAEGREIYWWHLTAW